LILQVIGLSSIPASRSGFLTSLTAVFIPLISSFVFRKPPRLHVWIGGALALLGVLILSGVISIRSASVASLDSKTAVPLNVGDALTTLGALFFSIQVLLIDWFGKRFRSAYFTPGMFFTTVAIAGFVFLGWSLSSKAGWQLNGSEAASWGSLLTSPVYLGSIAFLSLFCSLLAFLGMNTFQPAINASQASVIYSTEPLFASVWAMVLPGWISVLAATGYANEPMTVELAIGGILVTIANVISLWPEKNETQSQSPQSSMES
jgi:drug/metabolite transporter (DMT)-like permease